MFLNYKNFVFLDPPPKKKHCIKSINRTEITDIQAPIFEGKSNPHGIPKAT